MYNRNRTNDSNSFINSPTGLDLDLDLVIELFDGTRGSSTTNEEPPFATEDQPPLGTSQVSQDA